MKRWYFIDAERLTDSDVPYVRIAVRERDLGAYYYVPESDWLHNFTVHDRRTAWRNVESVLDNELAKRYGARK